MKKNFVSNGDYIAGSDMINEDQKICKKFGPTLLVNGDDLRSIFNLNKYSLKERKKLDKVYGNLIKFIIKQKYEISICNIILNP